MPVVLDSLTMHGTQRTHERDVPIERIAAYIRKQRCSIYKGHQHGTGVVHVDINGHTYTCVLQLTKRVGMVQHARLITCYPA